MVQTHGRNQWSMGYKRDRRISLDPPVLASSIIIIFWRACCLCVHASMQARLFNKLHNFLMGLGYERLWDERSIIESCEFTIHYHHGSCFRYYVAHMLGRLQWQPCPCMPASCGIFLSAGAMPCQAHTSPCCETIATTVLALPCVSKHESKTKKVRCCIFSFFFSRKVAKGGQNQGFGFSGGAKH